MFYALLGGAVVLLVVFVVVKLVTRKDGKQIAEIPGLQPRNESEGNLTDLAEAGSLHEFLTQLHEKFGPVASFWFGPKRVVSIYKPQNFKEYSAIFDRPPELFQLFEPLITSNSIQYANAEEGRRRHTAYARCFSQGRMQGYYKIWNELSWNAMQKLADLPPGEHIAIREHTFAFSIRAVLLATFGRYFDDDEKVQNIRKEYDMAWHYLERTLAGEVAEPGSDREREFLRNKQGLFDFLHKLVEWRADNPPLDEDDKLFVDVLIEMHGQDKDTLYGDAISMMLGGVHTTGLLLSWCLYYLAKHQDIQQRVLEEMDAAMGDEDDVHIEVYDKVRFMSQVLDETLRCAQLGPFAARVADTEMKLTDGSVTYTVPEGTPVAMALGVSDYDAERWPNPEEFNPDRFDPKTYKPVAFGFEPFGFAGKRKCPGYRFGLHEATVFLTHALRRFKFNLVPGQTAKKVYGLVTTTMEEIWLTVDPR